jgi:hypothetical protein
MKRFGIVLVALAAILILPGYAKADTITYTGASGSALSVGDPWIGSGYFSGSSLGSGTTSFSFLNLGGILNTITIGSGASGFTGYFTTAFTQTTGTCGSACTVWVANMASIAGSGYQGTGTITLDLTLTFGQWVISGGSATLGSSSVPEPGTLGMFAVGLAGLGLMLGRKSRALQLSA